jgi:pimeloyl-ACP methyl ester carboxylesterase/DNA-binding SARP family transcriptional activator
MRATIGLLGRFTLTIDGREMPAAALARRDPLRLIKLLALTPGHSMHREQLIEALWPDVDTADNRLHKSGYFVRRATGLADSIVIGGEAVTLFPGAEIVVDAEQFEARAREALRGDSEQVAADAVELYAGELLPLDPYEDWASGPRQRFALLHRELLRMLGRFDELVVLDPTDEGAHLAIMQRMIDRGDGDGALLQFELLRRMLDDELGIGPSEEAVAARDAAVRVARPATASAHSPGVAAVSAPPAADRPRYAPLATQQIRRVTTRDGVRLAYATSGTGPPLVKAANWMSHLDLDWGSPIWTPLWQELGRHHTLVRYDERGCGLSDWNVDRDAFTLDAWVRDLETVVDELGLERFPLLGLSHGGVVAIEYAARHPERVSHLVVFGTCSRQTWARATDDERAEMTALGQLIRTSWGGTKPGFRQVYDAKFMPDGPLEAWRAFDDLQRRSTSPQNAYRLWKAFGDLDPSDAALSLDVPTLIMHARGDQVWSYDNAEELHGLIRGSRLVPLESNNHILQAGEPAFGQFIAEVEAFIGNHPGTA